MFNVSSCCKVVSLFLSSLLEVFINFRYVCVATRERFRNRSFRERAQSLCGKNVERFVRDRREHVFLSVTNLTGYRRPAYTSTNHHHPLIHPVAWRKERQLHACIWIIVGLRRPAEVEIASKFGHRDSVSSTGNIGWNGSTYWSCTLWLDTLDKRREREFFFFFEILLGGFLLDDRLFVKLF